MGGPKHELFVLNGNVDALVEHGVSKCVSREGKTLQAFRRMPARKTKEKKLHMHT